MHLATKLMEGSEVQKLWPGGKVTKAWYYRFMKRKSDRLGSGASSPLEFDRAAEDGRLQNMSRNIIKSWKILH